jgi:hypothetical protein
VGWEASQTWSFRGSKSRNKVSVGEPAEGSLEKIKFRARAVEHVILYFTHPLRSFYPVAFARNFSTFS